MQLHMDESHMYGVSMNIIENDKGLYNEKTIFKIKKLSLSPTHGSNFTY